LPNWTEPGAEALQSFHIASKQLLRTTSLTNHKHPATHQHNPPTSPYPSKNNPPFTNPHSAKMSKEFTFSDVSEHTSKVNLTKQL
jgi:hypothetical protein